MRHLSLIMLCSLCLSAGYWGGLFHHNSSLTYWGGKPSYAAQEAKAEEVTNALIQSSDWVARIADQVMPSVVHIESTWKSSSSGKVIASETGSGVIVTFGKEGTKYVVTNRHVIRNAQPKDIVVQLQDGRQVHPAQKWDDEKTDVAVMRLPVTDVIPAEWAESKDVKIGNFVLAMGSPFGLSQSVTLGIISAKSRRELALGTKSESLINQDFLQTDAAINPGNSGGPLIDLRGRIVGINTAIASSTGGSEGVGFSIPSNMVKHIVEQLLEHGRVDRAYLGVTLDDQFTLEEARTLGLGNTKGARIEAIEAQTPAARANLLKNDVVLSVNGIDIEDERHLINIISMMVVGSKANLVIQREGQRETIVVLLGDRAELESR
ncbi:Periplasmic serine endoprotease DegP precursor [Polystyrenella longa]|uniref:Periplasmic serine endoprotease DegP n=1 Tax=Polystyrenella longa TaxID=2528007 RepID=A0A518CS96_9PLAN|nr:trypsin-like peptidase domain-containing protein [Polystyrenella longa]QDU82090.1 Periplasmic serine endoprotease DegP precursor [Polystyrenella longa]